MKLKIIDKNFAILKTPEESLLENSTFNVFCKIKEGGKNTYILEYEGENIPYSEFKDIDFGWKAIRTEEDLDFSDFGILSKILGEIAEIELSVLVISSFDHDYIFVKNLLKLKSCRSIELC